MRSLMRGVERATAALAFAIRWKPAGRKCTLVAERSDPAVSTPARSTSLTKQLPNQPFATMAKSLPEIDRPNLFIPAHSNVCRAVETFALASLLIVSTTVCVVLGCSKFFVE